jgi:endonuclease G
MIADFNNTEWGNLEDIVTRECNEGHKVSYFAGPIFRPSDPFFNELTSFVPEDEHHTGMRVPQSFWKIIFWIEDDELQAAGFILRQTDEIEAHGPIEEEINFGTYRKKRISEIEQRTGLRFPVLVDADTFAG